MKKIVTASLLALAAAGASAAEFGVFGARDYAGVNRNGSGISVGTNVAGLGVTAAFERTTAGTNDQDRLSVVVDRAVTTVGPVALSVKAGVAHLNNQHGADGYAMTVGAGVTLPLTKTVSATLDVARQYGQDRVSSHDGNRVGLGLKYAF